MRAATLRAAIRRGWVWPIRPATPRFRSRHIWGSWVVFPEPVSPQMMTTWLAAIAAVMSWRLSLTGSSESNAGVGMASRRELFFAADALMREVSVSSAASSPFCLSQADSILPSSRPKRCRSRCMQFSISRESARKSGATMNMLNRNGSNYTLNNKPYC